MKIKNTIVTIISIALFFADSAYPVMAEEATQPTIAMVSGGVGDAGMAAINGVSQDYNLKLIFANPQGEYLADVGVVISDKKGNVVVNTEEIGPVLLIKLKPGTYNLSSKTEKETKTSKVVVRAGSLRTYYIHISDS